MNLRDTNKLLTLWQHALENKANLILMRHGPKLGSNESGLSLEGIRLSQDYAHILETVFQKKKMELIHTDKARTRDTLICLFPHRFVGCEQTQLCPEDMLSNIVTPSLQDQCNKLHREIGHPRSYFVNHTYYFMEQWGAKFDCENLKVIGERMAKGIQLLASTNAPVTIYCGHSPAIEVGCEALLNISLSELGGFLNPLDSIHLNVRSDGSVHFVARVNPIIGYRDIESETYFD